MASKNLFITVDGKGNLVETTGTFSIGRRGSKDAPETIIFTSNYSKGSAPIPLVFQKGDLLEKSIVISGIGRPDTKTIFTLEKEEDKKDMLYRSLDKISGRKLSVNFKYLENEVENASKIQISIPFGLDEEGVKAFILDEISKTLN
jgi:hypothetical protein